MSYSLIIDTTSKYLVIGLGKDNKVIDETKYECWQRQSEFAVLEISKILSKNNIDVDDIDQIIVSKGPGSYTGVRIGLTIAKVWSITKTVKIKAISSLRALAGLDKKIALLDARSNRYYIGIYDNEKVILEDCIKEIDEVKELIHKYSEYEVVGEVEGLGLENKEINYSSNMLEIANISEEVKDIDRLIPTYLKEAY